MSALPPKADIGFDLQIRQHSGLVCRTGLLLRGLVLHCVRASKCSFLDSIGILCVPDILHDYITGASDHLFSPRRKECELALQRAHDDKAWAHLADDRAPNRQHQQVRLDLHTAWRNCQPLQEFPRFRFPDTDYEQPCPQGWPERFCVSLPSPLMVVTITSPGVDGGRKCRAA